MLQSSERYKCHWQITNPERNPNTENVTNERSVVMNVGFGIFMLFCNLQGMHILFIHPIDNCSGNKWSHWCLSAVYVVLCAQTILFDFSNSSVCCICSPEKLHRFQRMPVNTMTPFRKMRVPFWSMGTPVRRYHQKTMENMLKQNLHGRKATKMFLMVNKMGEQQQMTYIWIMRMLPFQVKRAVLLMERV